MGCLQIRTMSYFVAILYMVVGQQYYSLIREPLIADPLLTVMPSGLSPVEQTARILSVGCTNRNVLKYIVAMWSAHFGA